MVWLLTGRLGERIAKAAECKASGGTYISNGYICASLAGTVKKYTDENGDVSCNMKQFISHLYVIVYVIISGAMFSLNFFIFLGLWMKFSDYSGHIMSA